MPRMWAAAPILVVVFAALVFSQATPQLPKHAPELKRLSYFAGDWTSEGDVKASPMGPGGKFTVKDHYEWMKGGFFLVAHGTFEGAMGSGTAVSYVGYNTEEKVYTFDGYNSIGEAEHLKGTVSGDTWTLTNEEKMGGQVIKGRYSITVTSPTSYTFKFEMAPANSQWSTIMEGTATKAAKPAAPAKKSGAAKKSS